MRVKILVRRSNLDSPVTGRLDAPSRLQKLDLWNIIRIDHERETVKGKSNARFQMTLTCDAIGGPRKEQFRHEIAMTRNVDRFRS